jgi:hypothetical protein
MGGASCCNWASASRTGSGMASSRKLASCPSFISAPFMLPRVAATCSAVRSCSSASSVSRRAAEAKTRRARCDAVLAPTWPASLAIAALRDPRAVAEMW